MNYMKRREVLASIGLGSSVVAGCLRDDQQVNENTSNANNEHDAEQADETVNSDNTEVEYSEFEMCDYGFAPVNQLPEPAEKEAKAAIREGAYTTTDELLLPELIDIDTTYLEVGGLPNNYYEPVVTRDGETTRLQVKEALPARAGSIRIDNRLAEDVTIAARVEHGNEELLDDPVLVDDEITVEAETKVTLDGTEYFGEYHVQFELKELDLSEEDRWSVSKNSPSHKSLIVSSDEELVMGWAVSGGGLLSCGWDSEGNVVGHGKG